MFIGEAPGRHEDATGLPFQGEAGRIFNLALSYCRTTFHFHVTNAVGCRPTKVSHYGNIINRTPSPEELEACKPRVVDLLETHCYDGIAYLGVLPREIKIRAVPKLFLKHPSAILRKEYKVYDLKEFALKLDQFVEQLNERKDKEAS